MDRQSTDGDDSRTSPAMRESDVFDDSFAVDDFDVADGFRPSRTNSTISRRSIREPPTTSVAAHMSDQLDPSAVTSRSFRSSIRKSRGFMENPFSSVEDGEVGHHLSRRLSEQSQSTLNYAPAHSIRPISSASSRAFANTHSSNQVEAGPSHPYSMYPQDTSMGRTMSTSTIATTRAPARMRSLAEPTHPYRMYPQNVEDEMEEDETPRHLQTRIPLGFPGMPHRSHREHDTISISAHSEQLPPYSEYPEDGAPQHVVVPRQQTPTTPSVATPVQNPFIQEAPQSMSDANNVDDLDIRATAVEASSAGSVMSNKSWSQKSWKEKRKTRFCGVPFGWIVLATGVILFIVIVLSATIGGFLDARRKHRNAHEAQVSAAADHYGPYATSNPLYDASPIPTSTVPAAPTGTWSINLGAPQEVQADCLTDDTQNAGWSCDATNGQSLGLSIVSSSAGAPRVASLYRFDGDGDDDDDWSYGTEIASTVPAPLQLVTDMDDPGRGPAYHFQVMYNKVVVVPPSAFSPASVSSGSKRDYTHHVDNRWFTRHQVSAGDQPWVCYWNSTLVEFFVYIEEDSYFSWNSSASGSPPSGTSGAPYPSACSSPGSVSYSATGTTTSPTSSPSPDCSPDSWGPPNHSPRLPAYPYVAKLEERRVPGSPQPYCQKMQILDDGQAAPLIDPQTGAVYTVELHENDPGYTVYAGASSKSKERRKRTIVPGACHCQWLSGGS